MLQHAFAVRSFKQYVHYTIILKMLLEKHKMRIFLLNYYIKKYLTATATTTTIKKDSFLFCSVAQHHIINEKH